MTGKLLMPIWKQLYNFLKKEDSML